MIWLDEQDIAPSILYRNGSPAIPDENGAVTIRDNSGEIIDVAFDASGVHPRYAGMTYPERVARLQIDLMTASPAVVAEVSWVVGEVWASEAVETRRSG